MPRQLTFDLGSRTARGRGDFFVSDANAHAVAMIDATETWPGGKLLLLGPRGAGKTHLAHVWADALGARFIGPGENPADLSEPAVIEDADRWPQDQEATLFHLLNLATQKSLPVLLTARTPPGDWDVKLADLQSRLSALTPARIESPDDTLLMAVITKLFSDRQIMPPPSLIHWVLPRIERSFLAAERLVDRLDAAALSEGRAPTRSLARKLLEEETGS
jgi:chromosomal replication initiation ATPase DnaA